MDNFCKCQYEVISGFNGNNWLAIDVSKVGQGSKNIYVNRCCVIRSIKEKGEEFGKLHQTIHNVTKGINIMSTTIGVLVDGLHNMVKEMEYHAGKLHHEDKRFEVSGMFFFGSFSPLDKGYMIPFGSIRSLRFHTSKTV